MNKALKIGLIFLALILAALVVWSIKGPLDFMKDRDQRYVSVIAQMQDISDLQKEYRNQTGRYLEGIDSLINFADTGVFVLKERRDSIYTVFNGSFDETREIEVIKVIGKKSIKDSLFKGRTYKDLATMKVGKKAKFAIENRYKYEYNEDSTAFSRITPYFKVTAFKKDILVGLNENEIINELSTEKGIKGPELFIGSLTAESTEGNWSPDLDNAAEELKKVSTKK